MRLGERCASWQPCAQLTRQNRYPGTAGGLVFLGVGPVGRLGKLVPGSILLGPCFFICIDPLTVACHTYTCIITVGGRVPRRRARRAVATRGCRLTLMKASLALHRVLTVALLAHSAMGGNPLVPHAG